MDLARPETTVRRWGRRPWDSTVQQWRLRLLFLVTLAGLLALTIRLLDLQVLGGEEYRQLAGSQQGTMQPISSFRGAIQDASGQVLAGSVSYESLHLDSALLHRPDQLASMLAAALDVPESELRPRLLVQQRDLALVHEQLSAEQAERVRRLGRPELVLRSQSRRVHPEQRLAAQLLGTVAEDGRGLFGLEAALDACLRGKVVGLGAERGADVVLTVERSVQRLAEDELEQAVAKSQARGGVVVVLDPASGAILAMAGWPAFDPTQTSSADGQAGTQNPAASDAYEPVGIFQVVTMAAALDVGAVPPDDAFMNRGSFTYGGVVVQSVVGREPGMETMPEVLARPSSVGAAYVVSKLGPERFYGYLAAFGFGQATGLELLEDNPGFVRDLRQPDWKPLDLVNGAFGHGIPATPLQMATAVAAIANGGLLMKPHLVREIRRGDRTLRYDPVLVRQVISPSAAKATTQMLVAAVGSVSSPAAKAGVPGYAVAGVAGASGAHSSFVGYVPAERPRFLVLVRVDGTAGPDPLVAPSVFQSIARQLLAYYRVPPSTFRSAGLAQ